MFITTVSVLFFSVKISPYVTELLVNPRHCWILNQIVDSCLCTCKVELVFWISIVSGIPNSLSFIPDSTSKFPGFWNPSSLTWGWIIKHSYLKLQLDLWDCFWVR